MKEVFKIKSSTDVNKLAGAIAGAVREGAEVELQTIGAGAVNQAVKATIVAKSFLATGGIDIVLSPTFLDLKIDGAKRTVINMKVIKA